MKKFESISEQKLIKLAYMQAKVVCERWRDRASDDRNNPLASDMVLKYKNTINELEEYLIELEN